MKQFFYRIEDPNGLHARPAGQFATYAKRFACDVRVKVGEKEVDGKRLLALMTLGAGAGSELCVTLCGEDEQAAAIALEVYLREMGRAAKDTNKA